MQIFHRESDITDKVVPCEAGSFLEDLTVAFFDDDDEEISEEEMESYFNSNHGIKWDCRRSSVERRKKYGRGALSSSLTAPVLQVY